MRSDSQQVQEFSITQSLGGELDTHTRLSGNEEEYQTHHPGTRIMLLNNTDDPMRREHVQLLKNGKVVGSHIVRANELAQEIENALRRGLEDDSLSISIDRLAQHLHGWSAINSVSLKQDEPKVL